MICNTPRSNDIIVESVIIHTFLHPDSLLFLSASCSLTQQVGIYYWCKQSSWPQFCVTDQVWDEMWIPDGVQEKSGSGLEQVGRASEWN